MTDFELFVKNNRLTKKNIAEYLGVSAAFVTQLVQGKRSIPDDKMLRIKANKAWDSSMLKTDTTPHKTTTFGKPKGIPLIPIEAVAGFGRGDQAGVRYEDCEHYSVPEFVDRGVEFLIRVSGSSMYPKYANGDILACKKIHEILFIQWGKVHVIESASQGPLVKRIFEHDAETIQCVSDNREHYPPFLMPKSDIRSLSIVLGVIRLE